MRGRYNKHVEREPNVIEENYDYENGIDWLAKMNDSPFDAYYVGALPLKSWPWADIDTVSWFKVYLFLTMVCVTC